MIGIKYCGRQKSTSPPPRPKKDVCTLEPVNMFDYMAKEHQIADGIKVAKSADLSRIFLGYLVGSRVITEALKSGRQRWKLEFRVMSCEKGCL